jgi:hypothetical protein
MALSRKITLTLCYHMRLFMQWLVVVLFAAGNVNCEPHLTIFLITLVISVLVISIRISWEYLLFYKNAFLFVNIYPSEIPLFVLEGCVCGSFFQ